MAVSGSETAATTSRPSVVTRRRRSSGSSTGSSSSSSSGPFGDTRKRIIMKRRTLRCAAAGAISTKWLVDYRRKQAQLSANSLLRLQSLVDSTRKIKAEKQQQPDVKSKKDYPSDDDEAPNQQSRSSIASSISSASETRPAGPDHDPILQSAASGNKESSNEADSSSPRRTSDPMAGDSEHSINLHQVFKESDHAEKNNKYEKFSISVKILDHHDKIQFLLRNPEIVKAVRRALQQRQEEEQEQAAVDNRNNNNNNTTKNKNNKKIPMTLRREIKCIIPHDRFQLPQMQAIRKPEPRLSGGGGGGTSHHSRTNSRHTNRSIPNLTAQLHCIAEDYNEASASEVCEISSVASGEKFPGHASRLSQCSSCSSFAADSFEDSSHDSDHERQEAMENRTVASIVSARQMSDDEEEEEEEEVDLEVQSAKTGMHSSSYVQANDENFAKEWEAMEATEQQQQQQQGADKAIEEVSSSDDDSDDKESNSEAEEESSIANSYSTTRDSVSTVRSSIASSTVHGSIASSTVQSSVAESTVADTVAAVVSSLLMDDDEEDEDEDEDDDYTEPLLDESHTEFDDATEFAHDDDLTECQHDDDTVFGCDADGFEAVYDTTENGEEWDDHTEVHDEETEVGGVDEGDLADDADIRDEAEEPSETPGVQVIASDAESEREEPQTDGEDSCLTNNTDDSSHRNLNYGLSVYLSNHSPRRQHSQKLGKKIDEDSRTSVTESVTSVSRSLDESNQTSNTNKTGSSKGTLSSYRTSSSHVTSKTNRTSYSAPGALLRVDSRSSLCSTKSELDTSVHSRHSLSMEDLSRQSRASSAPIIEGPGPSRRRLSLMLGEQSHATEASEFSNRSEADDSTVGSAADHRRRPKPRRSRSSDDLNQSFVLRGGRRRGHPGGVGVDASGLIPRSNTPMGTLLRTRSGELSGRSRPSDARPRLPPRLKSNDNSSMDGSMQRSSRRTPARSRSMLGASSNGTDRSRGVNRTRSGHRDSFLGGSKIKKWDSSVANKSGHGLSLLERHLNEESTKAKNRATRRQRPSTSSRDRAPSIASLSSLLQKQQVL